MQNNSPLCHSHLTPKCRCSVRKRVRRLAKRLPKILPRILPRRLLGAALFCILTLPLLSPAKAEQARGKAFLVQIQNKTDHRMDSWTFGEGVWVLHDLEHPLFKHGEQLYDNGMKVLIEQGKAHEILKGMIFHKGVASGAPFPKKMLRAGERQSFVISALPGQRFSFAIALLETNDKFLAPAGKGIALFDFFKTPVSATVTDQVHLWDGGSAHDTKPQQNVMRGKKVDMRMEKKLSKGEATKKADSNTATRRVMTGEKAHHDGYRYPRVETIMFVSIKAL